MINGISTTWLPVDDVRRALAFYRDDLGLEVVERDGDWGEVIAGDQRIGLNSAESPSGEGGAVIAFSVDDLEATVLDLQEKGIEFPGGISEHPWGRIVAFKDPDGNDLQLFTSTDD